MTDTMRLLARVAHEQAQASGADLEDVAAQQEANLAKKQQYRDLEKFADKIASDDTITQAELGELTAWMESLGLDPNTDGLATSGDIKIGGADDMETSQNKEKFETGLLDVIESAKDSVEDDQQEVQFQIQMGTSDLQNAENVRSQAEKRLETQRKDLTRNWAG